jgi:hypothetical protein
MHVICRHKRLYSNIYKGLNSDEVVRSCKEVYSGSRICGVGPYSRECNTGTSCWNALPLVNGFP